MAIKMKTLSNIAAWLGISLVIGSFILNATGLTTINMDDALKAG
jgi:hypothetical protein